MHNLTVYIPLLPEEARRLDALARKEGCSPEARASALLRDAILNASKPVNPLINTSACPNDTIDAVRDVLALVVTASNIEDSWHRTAAGISCVLGMVDDALVYEEHCRRPWFGDVDAEEHDEPLADAAEG